MFFCLDNDFRYLGSALLLISTSQCLPLDLLALYRVYTAFRICLRVGKCGCAFDARVGHLKSQSETISKADRAWKRCNPLIFD